MGRLLPRAVPATERQLLLLPFGIQGLVRKQDCQAEELIIRFRQYEWKTFSGLPMLKAWLVEQGHWARKPLQ